MRFESHWGNTFLIKNVIKEITANQIKHSMKIDIEELIFDKGLCIMIGDRTITMYETNYALLILKMHCPLLSNNSKTLLPNPFESILNAEPEERIVP